MSLVSSKAVSPWLIQFWTLQYTAMEENSPLNKAYVTAVTRLGLPEQPLPHVARAVVSKHKDVYHTWASVDLLSQHNSFTFIADSI